MKKLIALTLSLLLLASTFVGCAMSSEKMAQDNATGAPYVEAPYDGEYARDDDGDGFCEAHVNTMEGTWSLLRSWLRPHRGISQEKLPLYLGFSSSCTTLGAAAKPSSAPLSPLWSCNGPHPDKSQIAMCRPAMRQ